MNKDQHIAYHHTTYSEEEMLQRSSDFYLQMNARRSVRDFSPRDFPREILDNIIATAGTAPSGANKQPWTFCVITNAELKSKIREMAEEEERISYGGRMSEKWLKDLAPLGTDANKHFTDKAPYIVVIFKKPFDYDSEENKLNNYYVNESVGIAVGIFLSAVQNAGLAALTHTPSPMNFLQKALNRPDNERAYLLIPVGYPTSEATVPNIHRKNLKEIRIEYK